jgi:hypothetical protein
MLTRTAWLLNERRAHGCFQQQWPTGGNRHGAHTVPSRGPVLETDTETLPALQVSGIHRPHLHHLGFDAYHPAVRLPDAPAIPAFGANVQNLVAVTRARHAQAHFGEQRAPLVPVQAVPVRRQGREFLVAVAAVRVLRSRVLGIGHGRPCRCEQQQQHQLSDADSDRGNLLSYADQDTLRRAYSQPGLFQAHFPSVSICYRAKVNPRGPIRWKRPGGAASGPVSAPGGYAASNSPAAP